MSDDNRIGEKVVFWVIAAPIVIVLGCLLPGYLHIVLAAGAMSVYKEVFGR